MKRSSVEVMSIAFLFLSIAVVLSNCGGGGGGSSGPTLQPPAFNLTGTWKQTETLTGNPCGAPYTLDSDTYTFNHQQGSNTVVVTNTRTNEVNNVTMSGNTLTLSRQLPNIAGCSSVSQSITLTCNSENHCSGPNTITCGGTSCTLTFNDSYDKSTSSLAMKGTSGNAVDMNGTWKACQRDASGPWDVLATGTLNGAASTWTASFWSAPVTANCQQTASPDMILAETDTITLGPEATATWTNGSGSASPPAGIPVNAKATQVTNVLHTATLTVNSASLATALNNSAICGRTNWAVGVPTDVLSCTDFVSSTTLTDYWVVDDASAQLKMYNQNIATAAYQVDSINPYVKQ